MGVMLFIVLESDDVGTDQQSELGRAKGRQAASSQEFTSCSKLHEIDLLNVYLDAHQFQMFSVSHC